MSLARKRLSRWLMLVFLTLLIYFGFGGDTNLYRLWQLTRGTKSLETKIDLTKKRNDRLREEIGKLESDLLYVEKIAREKYNMGYDGEVIYRIHTRVDK